MPESLSLAQIMGSGNAPSPTQPQTLSLAQITGTNPSPNPPPIAGAGAASYFQQHPGMDPLAVEQAFQQLPAATAANQYLASHPGMDATAVHTAFGVGPQKGMTALEAQRQIDEQNRAAQGMAGNAGTGALSNYTGLGGQVQEGLGQVAGALGIDQAAENYKLAAERTFGTAPQNGSFAGTVGRIAGNPMTYLGAANAGPAGQLAAGMSALNEAGMAAHNIDVARQNGQFVGTGQALENIGAHGLLDYVANRVAQKGITGDFSGALAPVLKNAIARVAARYATTASVEGLAGVGNQVLNNLIEKATGVNPEINLTDNIWHAALQQATLGTAGQAIHEAVQYKGEPQPQNLNDRSSFLGRMRIKQAAKQAVEQANAQRAPTVQPPTGEEPSIRVQGEEHLIQPEAYDVSRAEGTAEPTPAPNTIFGKGEYKETPAPQTGRPSLPPESGDWTNEQIREWANKNGYDLSQASGPGKKPALTLIGQQHEADKVSQEWESASSRIHAAYGQPAALPSNAASMDAGALRQWAEQNGIRVPDSIGDLPRPRIAMLRYLRDVTGETGAAPESVAGAKPAQPGEQGNPEREQAAQQRGEEHAQPVEQSLSALNQEVAHPSGHRQESASTESGKKPPVSFLPEQAAKTVEERVGGKVVEDPSTLHEGHQEVLNVGKELTGRDVIPYQGGRGRGFHLNGDTYYSVDKNPTMAHKRETIGHEVTHWLQDNKPEIVKPIAYAIPDSIRKDFDAEYAKAYEAQEGKPLPENQRQRELEAYAVGKAMARPGVMRQVMQSNPSAFQQFADTVMTKLRSLTAKGQLTNQIIESLKQAREEAAGIKTSTPTEAETAGVNFLPEREPDRKLRGPRLFDVPEAPVKQPLPRATLNINKLPVAKGAFRAFVDSDAKSAAGAVKSLWQGIHNLFGMQSGTEADVARGIWRNRGAELQHRYDQLHTALDSVARHVDRDFSIEDMHAAQDAWERGSAQPKPEIQQAVDAIKAAQEDRWQQINKLDPGGIGYIENYYKHSFKDVDKAADVLAQMTAKRPLGGNSGFRKTRGLPTMADARAMGLEEVEPNPIRNGIMAIHTMDKYITALESREQMQANGLLKDAPERGVPEGWAKVGDPIFKGKIMPKEVASLVGNMLDPGVTGSQRFGKLARATLGAGNVANMLQLGLNLYHVAKTSWESIKSEGAQGTRSLLSIPGNLKEGEYQRAAANTVQAGKKYLLAGTGFGPIVRDFMEGSRIRQEWLKPGTTDAHTAAMVDVLKEAGHRAIPDTTYRTGFADAMAKAWRDNNMIGAALRLPLAAMEKATAPILHQYVPRIKNGVAAEMVRQELTDLGTDADINDVRKALGRAVDSVDNRFGMMNQDHLFWHKSLREVGQLLIRALSYQTGTVREFGGGAKDLLTAGAQAATGNGKFTDTLRSNRLAYAITSPVMSAIAGGILTYAMTGHRPKKALDYFYPDTGKKDADGQPIRLKLPNYENDIQSFTTDPIQTIRNKESGLIGIGTGLATGKDFRGVKISEESPVSPKGIWDRMAWAATQLEPISSQNTRRMLKEGEGWKAALPELGITQAGKGLDWSDAEREGHRILGEQGGEGGRTEEQAERSDLTSRLAQRIREGDQTAVRELGDAVKAGKLPPGQIASVMKRATGPQGIQGVVTRIREPHDLMRVWQRMTPQEKHQTAGLVIDRIADSTALTAGERQELFGRISDGLKGTATASK